MTTTLWWTFLFPRRRLLQSRRRMFWAAVTAATTTCGCCSAFFVSSLEERADNDGNDNDKPLSYQIPINFMEKLARKPYLLTKQQHATAAASATVSSSERPPGVPPTLRLVAVDVPQLRHAFSGSTCRVAADHVYPDGVAPPKPVEYHQVREHDDDCHEQENDTKTSTKKKKKRSKKQRKDDNDDDTITLQVEQKVWVKSLFQCVVGSDNNSNSNDNHQVVGVQVMQADTAALNPHNLRRTHQFGRLRYDPGKYSSTTTTTEQPPPSSSSSTTSKSHDGKQQQQQKQQPQHAAAAVAVVDVVSPQDELEAPWNQYAWMQELPLRIGGRVAFGAPLQAAKQPWWKRFVLGRDYAYIDVYQSTIPSQKQQQQQRSLWHRLLSPLLFFWKTNHSSNEGLDDGISNNWASHKPHAVIANGASLQRVPNSLKLLQRACQEHNVPLFVINDPRTWGGNTHATLADALRDLQRTVKTTIVTNSLQQTYSGTTTAFARGRAVGQWETETKWQAKELLRKSKETLQRAEDARKRKQQQQQQQEMMDWKELDAQELEEKLVRRGVIQKEQETDQDGKERRIRYSCTQGMLAVARKCISCQEPRKKEPVVLESQDGKSQKEEETANG